MRIGYCTIEKLAFTLTIDLLVQYVFGVHQHGACDQVLVSSVAV